MITEIFLTMSCLISVVPINNHTGVITTYSSQMFGDEKVFCDSVNYEYPEDGYRDVELKYKVGVTEIDPIVANPFAVYYSTVIQVFFPDFDTYNSNFTIKRTAGNITKISAGYQLNTIDYSNRNTFTSNTGSLGFIDINSNNEFVITTNSAISAAKQINQNYFYLTLQIAYMGGYGEFDRKIDVLDATDIDNDGLINDSIEVYNPKLTVTTSDIPTSDFGNAKEYFNIYAGNNWSLRFMNCYMYAIINSTETGMGVTDRYGESLNDNNGNYNIYEPYNYCYGEYYSDELFDNIIVPNVLNDLIYNKKRTARLLTSSNDKIYDFERKIAFRVRINPNGIINNFHFMKQLSNGQWCDKIPDNQTILYDNSFDVMNDQWREIYYSSKTVVIAISDCWIGEEEDLWPQS